MRLRTLLKINLSLLVTAIALCSFPTEESFSVPPAQSSATIAATATVIEPLGIVEQPNLSRHQQYLLYSPHHSHTIYQVSHLDADCQGSNGAVCFVSESATVTSPIQSPWVQGPEIASGTYLVTIIYSEN